MTTVQMVKLKPSLARLFIEVCIDARQPAFVHGKPGIGKSDLVAQIAADRGQRLWDCRLSLWESVDLRGVPYVRDEYTHWAVPVELPQPGEGPGILFLDEFNRTQVQVLNAVLQLCLAPHKLGSYTLPPDVAIVAAGNFEADGGGGLTRVPDACRYRFTHCYVDDSVEDWTRWAIDAGLEPVVISYISWRPEALSKYDRIADSAPNPRSWHFLSNIIRRNPPPVVMLALATGTVGFEYGVDFCSYLRLYQELPTIQGILLNPATEAVPKDGMALYATAARLATAASPTNIGRILIYLDRLPAQEYAAFAVKTAQKRVPAIANTNEFRRWAIAHQDLFK